MNAVHPANDKKTIVSDEQPIVIAMIVDVEGSAYRKEGAWMLIHGDGTREGIISGGFLESDLQERARNLFGRRQVEVVRYDLFEEDDFSLGLGIGCNGVVTVLVRDVEEKLWSYFSLIHKQLWD